MLPTSPVRLYQFRWWPAAESSRVSCWGPSSMHLRGQGRHPLLLGEFDSCLGNTQATLRRLAIIFSKWAAPFMAGTFPSPGPMSDITL